MQVIIFSKNSVKGIWEIDGIARVSSDGSSVVTEEGMGLTHFSEIFQSPLGPTVGQIGAQDRPGADTFNGAMSTSIALPSYKSLGRDIAPGLVYKSSWAKPTITITNLFDIPRNEVAFTPYTQTARSLFGKSSSTVSGVTWVEPDFVDAQFFSEDIVSSKIRFSGLPQKSVVSYAMDLSSLDSGVHPYTSKYEMHLKRLIFATITTTSKKLFGRTRTSQESFSETRKIKEIFPSDVSGPLYLQNKINSPAGRGWHIGGVQKITNPASPRIMIEEADGSIAAYTINDTINTLYDGAANGRTQFKAVDLSSWPAASFLDQSNSIRKVDLTEENPDDSNYEDVTTQFSGGVGFLMYYRPGGDHGYCERGHTAYEMALDIKNLLTLPSGEHITSDYRSGMIYINGSNTVLGGEERDTTRTFFPSISPAHETYANSISRGGFRGNIPLTSAYSAAWVPVHSQNLILIEIIRVKKIL